MSISGFSLVLAAALCHAIWNYFVKRIDGGPELIWLFSLVAVILYLPLAIWILAVEQPDLGLPAIVFILGSVVLHLGYFLLLQAGYRTGAMSVVYPVARASGPLLSTTFAVLALNEVVTLQMGVGALIIVFGVLMLAGGIRTDAKDARGSLFFGLGAGTLIGAYTVWDAYAVSVLLAPPLLLDYVSSLGRLVILAPVANRNRERIRRQWRDHKLGVIAIGVFSPLAYILILYALTFTPVTYVAPLREISVLLVVLAGSLLLKEGRLKQRLAWAAVILAGMALLVSA
ncbi:MAG: DMT family transporter [Alphaproteobacteria bacterium]|nr:DMT family transporter [Alphaproteobacteria bacterium]